MPAGRAVEENHRPQLAAEAVVVVVEEEEGHSSMVVGVEVEDCSWSAAVEGAGEVGCCWLAEVRLVVLEAEDSQDAQVVLEAVVQVQHWRAE